VSVLASAVIADSSSPSWLDPVIIGIIITSVVLGVFRGLIRSVAGVLGLVLAALFAGRFAALFDPALDQAHIKHPPVTGAWAFVLAFIVIVVAVEVVANLLRFVQKVLFLGWIDRVGGALFGLFRGVLISMILLAGLAMFGSSQFNSEMRQAQVAVFLWQNMSGLAGMLPQGMQQSVIRLVHDQAPFTQQKATGQ
jgi:membrane protein required for colicin V production